MKQDSKLNRVQSPVTQGTPLPDAVCSVLALRPVTLKEANDFVENFHRHNGRTSRDGGKYAIGLNGDEELVGVAIVGNPLSATLMDGYTAEVLRVCVVCRMFINRRRLIFPSRTIERTQRMGATNDYMSEEIQNQNTERTMMNTEEDSKEVVLESTVLLAPCECGRIGEILSISNGWVTVGCEECSRGVCAFRSISKAKQIWNNPENERMDLETMRSIRED